MSGTRSLSGDRYLWYYFPSGVRGRYLWYKVPSWGEGYLVPGPFWGIGIPSRGIPEGVGIPKLPPQLLTSSGGHQNGQYASYWNAFLLTFY